MLAAGRQVTITQSSISIEQLLGKFIFSMGNLSGGQKPGSRRPGRSGGGAEMTIAPPETWPQPDGTPVSCREKLKTLAENHAELAQVMQDAFEDAVLMGVDEPAMRGILDDMVRQLAARGAAGCRMRRRAAALLAASAAACRGPWPGAAAQAIAARRRARPGAGSSRLPLGRRRRRRRRPRPPGCRGRRRR